MQCAGGCKGEIKGGERARGSCVTVRFGRTSCQRHLLLSSQCNRRQAQFTPASPSPASAPPRPAPPHPTLHSPLQRHNYYPRSTNDMDPTRPWATTLTNDQEIACAARSSRFTIYQRTFVFGSPHGPRSAPRCVAGWGVGGAGNFIVRSVLEGRCCSWSEWRHLWRWRWR